MAHFIALQKERIVMPLHIFCKRELNRFDVSYSDGRCLFMYVCCEVIVKNVVKKSTKCNYTEYPLDQKCLDKNSKMLKRIQRSTIYLLMHVVMCSLSSSTNFIFPILICIWNNFMTLKHLIENMSPTIWLIKLNLQSRSAYCSVEHVS